MKFILFLSLPLYALDQWTKQLVLRFVSSEGPGRIVIADFFSLVNVTNTGAAFGSFRNNNTFFIAISLIASHCCGPSRATACAKHLARRIARVAAGRHPGKSHRSSSLWARNRFSPFRLARPLRASLARLQC